MGWRSGCRAHCREGQGGGGKLKEALLWSLDHYDEWKAAKEAGDVPEELEPPEVLEGYGGWHEDFWRLSTERQIGFGIGPIPASAIDKHVTGWSYDDAEIFEFCIREMDGLYLMRNNDPDSAPSSGSPMDAFRSATAGRRGR